MFFPLLVFRHTIGARFAGLLVENIVGILLRQGSGGQFPFFMRWIHVCLRFSLRKLHGTLNRGPAWRRRGALEKGISPEKALLVFPAGATGPWGRVRKSGDSGGE